MNFLNFMDFYIIFLNFYEFILDLFGFLNYIIKKIIIFISCIEVATYVTWAIMCRHVATYVCARVRKCN